MKHTFLMNFKLKIFQALPSKNTIKTIQKLLEMKEIYMPSISKINPLQFINNKQMKWIVNIGGPKSHLGI